MNRTALLRLAKRRSKQLQIDVQDVLDAGSLGAYSSTPLNLVEYCLHEAGHLITLGFHPDMFGVWVKNFCRPSETGPASFQDAMSYWFDGLSKNTADALEIDTAIVTYLAGVKLSLWTDPEPIQNSCARNLTSRGLASGSRIKEVKEAFANASSAHTHQSELLSNWFQGKAAV